MTLDSVGILLFELLQCLRHLVMARSLHGLYTNKSSALSLLQRASSTDVRQAMTENSQAQKGRKQQNHDQCQENYWSLFANQLSNIVINQQLSLAIYIFPKKICTPEVESQIVLSVYFSSKSRLHNTIFIDWVISTSGFLQFCISKSIVKHHKLNWCLFLFFPANCICLPSR